MDSFRQFIEDLGQELNLPALAPDKKGLLSLNIDGNSVLNIQFLPAARRALIFLPVADISELPVSRLRKFLSANLFGRGTGGGWFGLEENSGILVYHYLTDFRKPPEPGQFLVLLEQILKLCENWRRQCLRMPSMSPKK